MFQTLSNKETVKELFGTVADKIADRPGGYTRIIKLGNRAGDNADTCLIELVDFNETLLAAAAEKAAATTKTRRSRRGSGSRQVAGATTEAAPVAAEVADAPSAEVVGEEPAVDAAEPAEAAPVAETTEATPADDTSATPEASTDEEPKQS